MCCVFVFITKTLNTEDIFSIISYGIETLGFKLGKENAILLQTKNALLSEWKGIIYSLLLYLRYQLEIRVLNLHEINVLKVKHACVFNIKQDMCFRVKRLIDVVVKTLHALPPYQKSLDFLSSSHNTDIFVFVFVLA
jgi:hypothetical protein